jgi:hypothetical protein
MMYSTAGDLENAVWLEMLLIFSHPFGHAH